MSKRIKIIQKVLFWNDADESCIFINDKENKTFPMICGLLNSRDLGEQMSHSQIADYFNIHPEIIERAMSTHKSNFYDSFYRSTYNLVVSSMRSKNLA